jgi:hypothetical protein
MGGPVNIGLLMAALGVDASEFLSREPRRKVEPSDEELASLRDKAQAKRDRRNAKRLRDQKACVEDTNSKS